MPDETPTRVRLNLVSEIAFSTDGAARPIHIFRAGTYTDMSGRETSFGASDIEAIVANFKAGKRKRPPITERHDWGRAIGRIATVWSDGANENLYAQPNWNATGRALLSDEVYDGFSCELEQGGNGWVLIGGSLTNYPAVDGLEPITLAAPPIEVVAVEPLAPGGARLDIPITTQEQRNMEENTPLESAAPQNGHAPPEESAPIVAELSAADQARIDRLVSQREQEWQARERLLLAEAEARFERRIAEERARTAIAQYAQHATTPTLQRQHALPIEAETLTAFLSSLNASQRTAAQGLFSRILDAGLVSFEEIGSAGEAPPEQSAAEKFSAAVNAKVSAGMSRLSAIQAIAKEQPELYAEYRADSTPTRVAPAPRQKGGR